MIVGFSKHGRGRALRAVAYLTAETVPGGALSYVLGDRNRKGVVRNPAPIVLRGDSKLIARLIDESLFLWKYTSGVLSLAPGERLTLAQENQLMDEFEAIAFAGLTSDRYAILWVRHAHAGHPELHFIVPRTELLTGKSLNIAPPGPKSRALFDVWRSKINAEFGLADPDDPARRRAFSLPAHIAKLKDQPGQTRAAYNVEVRKTLTGFIEAKVRDGSIRNRADVVRALQQAGFTIPRRGQDYITVEHPATGERFRLRGIWYGDKALPEVQQFPSPPMANRPDPKRAARFAQRLEPLRQARADYHRQRYGNLPSQTKLSLNYDRTGDAPAYRSQKVGRRIPSPRRGVCRQTEGFDRATRNVECANNRLGRAHRRFARDYEALLMRPLRRHRTKALLREYTRVLNSSDRQEEIELERELEL